MRRILLTMGLFSILSAPMFGGILIDFSGSMGGTISCSISTCAAGSALTGTNISITSMLVVGTPASDGTYAITGGTLNFTTNTLGQSTNVVINGTVGACSLGACGGHGANPVPSGDLLKSLGTDNFSFTTLNGAIQVSGNGPDTKLPALLAYLGIPTVTQWNFAGFTIGGVATATPGTFTATSTDLGNNSVPEPASILLLGTVLVGVTQVIRRRTSKA